MSRSTRTLNRRNADEGSIRSLTRVLSVVLVCACLSFVGCALRPQVKRVCLDIEASDQLNVYEGTPHAVSVFLYALSDSAGFKAAPPAELLVGHLPEGVIEPPVPFTIAPATKTRLEKVFPASTQSVGVLADYHRPPGDAEEDDEDGDGLRAVVPARCGLFTPGLKLSAGRIEYK